MSELIDRQMAIDAIKDMYRAAEKWLRDATDDVTKARAESCMASLVEIKLRTEKLPVVQPDHVADIGKKVEKEDCVSRLAAIDALDIAIERYDEMAEEYRKKADIERNDYMDMRDDAYEARQLAQWLNELKHLRGEIEQLIMRLPSAKQEIINCFECTHYKPISNSWGKCYVHSSRTERYRTCQSCDYCSWAEKE